MAFHYSHFFFFDHQYQYTTTMFLIKRHNILFYIGLSPLAYGLLSHLYSILTSLFLHHNNKTESIIGTDSTIVEAYSALGELNNILNRIIYILARFCITAINDPMCFPMCATLVGLAATSYAIMSVERVRFDNHNKLFSIIIVLFGNVIGTSIIATIAWLPIYGWSVRKHYLYGSKKQDEQIQVTHKNLRSGVIANHSLPYVEPHKTFGIALATLFGQFLPVAILVSHGQSLNENNILAALQYFPVTYVFFQWIVPNFVEHLNLKSKSDAVDSVRLMYTSIASINTFISYWVWIKWFQTTSLPEVMVKHWAELFFSFGATDENPVTYILMWGIIGVFSTFACWACLEDGKQGLKILIQCSILFGPGAGLALYAMKRESRI
jgi:hypothetical protein